MFLECTGHFQLSSSMARKLRVQYPGAIYHVMNRGDLSEVIFREERDREMWMATLAEACRKTEWQIHAFCLTSNHSNTREWISQP